MNVIKSYARRDSATALLRKMGVDKSAYEFFITPTNGQFDVDMTKVEKHLSDVKSFNDELVTCVVVGSTEASVVHPIPEPEVIVIPKATTKKVAEPTKPAEEMTVSDVARTLILEGKTNKEVWAVIKAQFNLDDSKKSYPSWYRCELKRKGQL